MSRMFTSPGPLPEPKYDFLRPTNGMWGVRFIRRKWEYGILVNHADMADIQKALASGRTYYVAKTFRNGEKWIYLPGTDVEFIPPIS